MKYYLGLDASTQSVSAVVISLEDGRIVGDESVAFEEFPAFHCPQGFLKSADPLVKHADPLVWLAALEALLHKLKTGGIDLASVAAISGSGQQHGTVYLNEAFLAVDQWDASDGLVNMVRPMLSRPTAPIWMDSSTSAECAEISRAAGGAAVVQKVTGSPAIERFSGPQIRKFWKDAPAEYEATAIIHLVSSFMASILIGKSAPIDIGDGAGMNLVNLQALDWDEQMLAATAPGLRQRLPALVPSSTVIGTVAPYLVKKYGFRPDTAVVAWSGDNPNSLIGVGGYAPGTAVISLGTSHTYFGAMHEPRVDPAGYGHVFGNPAGGFMSLICFKNGALAQEEIRMQHGLSWKQFDQCLKDTPTGNNGNMMLPYFVPEITPLVLKGKPVRVGSQPFVDGRDAASSVRAVVEAQALRLRLHSEWIGEATSAVRVTGGASVSDEVCQVLADVFDSVIERLETGNSAGLGAAMRAAQAAGAASWEQLSQMYSRPVRGKDVTPIPENVEVYRKMLPEYAAFAAQHQG
jgi:xylulokinase